MLSGIPALAAAESERRGEAVITASTLCCAATSPAANSVPAPQANVSGRSLWFEVGGLDWVEARNRSSEDVPEVLAGQDVDRLCPGAAAVRDRYADRFHFSLWGRPNIRKLWVPRHRNEQAIREIGDELAWGAASDLDHILPTELLSTTVRHAILDQYAESLDMRDQDDLSTVRSWELILTQPMAKMLDWLVRHHPDTAQDTIGSILRNLQHRHEVSAAATGQALHRALRKDGSLDARAPHRPARP